MADACEAVAAMIESIAPQEHAAHELHAIVALIPLLEQRARDAGMVPPVRAVYAGAATRIREVQIAEAAVAGGSAADIDDEDMDDDDLDDDDLDDDDLDAAHDVPPDGAVSS
jgi:hypothetical protein